MRPPPSSLHQALLITRLDLTRRLRDKSILLQVFAAPLLLAVIVGGAFGGGGGNLDATIVIVDADRTTTSAAIATSITAASDASGGLRFTSEAGDESSATTAVDDGAADAAVVIPAGFTAAVAAGQPAELVVVGDASTPIVTGVADSVAAGISTRLHAAYLGSTTAAQTAAATGRTLDPAAVTAALSSPPAIELVDERLSNNFNIISFFAPGMAMIFLFFVMGTTARSVLTEQREGTLPRILASPVTPTSVVLGKALAVFVLGMLSMLTVYVATTLLFGVDWGDPIGVLLVITSVVIAIAGISLIVTGLARSEEQAQALTIIGSLVLALAGGTFVYTASGPLATARNFTPNGQALMAFIDLSAGQAAWTGILGRVAIILAIGLVTGLIGIFAIRRGLE